MENYKYVLCWIMYIIGLICFGVFESKIRNIDERAWRYSIGASVGAALFTSALCLK